VVTATAAYAAVTVVQRGLPLVLLPIYTRALTPAEYGELGVLIALGIGLAYLLSFGQEVSLFRQLFQIGENPHERRRLLETGANLLRRPDRRRRARGRFTAQT
jgi:steroid 5-alpha reductase family enzyme